MGKKSPETDVNDSACANTHEGNQFIPFKSSWSTESGFNSAEFEPKAGLRIPPELGKEHLNFQTVSNGCGVFHFNAVHNEAVRINGTVVPDSPFLVLRLPLAGQARIEVIGTGAVQECSDRYGLFLHSRVGDSCVIDTKPQELSEVVAPLITQERLRMMLNGMRLPAVMDKFLGGQPGNFVGSPRLSPAMRRLGVQLRSNPYTGDLGNLYTYGKLFEILAMALNDLVGGTEADARIARAERLKVSRVCERLMDNLAAAPTLETLAIEVGLSPRRLAYIFREITGKTVMAWVIEQKLIMAGDMLREGTLSIKEIAHLIGYAHQSTFTEAFVRKFGFPPNIYRAKTIGSSAPYS